MPTFLDPLPLREVRSRTLCSVALYIAPKAFTRGLHPAVDRRTTLPGIASHDLYLHLKLQAGLINRPENYEIPGVEHSSCS